MDVEKEFGGSLYCGFYVLLEPIKESAEIPHSLVEWFGDRLSETVVLRDVSKNSFNITLSKEKGRFAFTRGVQRLLKHYVLPNGAWMRVFYLGGSEFHMQLMNRELNMVKDYHQAPNQYEFGWKDFDRVDDHYDNGPETYE